MIRRLSQPTSASTRPVLPVFLNPANATGPSGYVEEPLEGMNGATTARPEDWEEVNDGVWARGQTDLDTTVVLTLGVRSSGCLGVTFGADVLLNVLSAQFGLDTNSSTSYSSNGIDWNIVDGDFNGAPVKAAAGEASGGAIAVIFIYDPAESALWETVILDILDRTRG